MCPGGWTSLERQRMMALVPYIMLMRRHPPGFLTAPEKKNRLDELSDLSHGAPVLEARKNCSSYVPGIEICRVSILKSISCEAHGICKVWLNLA
jgi:hypothetical protein